MHIYLQIYIHTHKYTPVLGASSTTKEQGDLSFPPACLQTTKLESFPSSCAQDAKGGLPASKRKGSIQLKAPL